MKKHKIKRFIAMTMAAMMTLSSNAFATEINLENSSANVSKHGTVTKDSGSDTFNDETTNVWQDGTITEEVRVNVDVASSFTITIPKEIVLDGNTGKANYVVNAKGDIAGDQKITVTPDASFTLSETGGKANVTATVTQANTEYDYTKLQGDGTEYDGNISATLTAGEWSGKFNFNIELKAENCEHSYIGTLTKEATETENGKMIYTCSKCGKVDRVESVAPSFATMSWSAISNISEAGNAASTFSVGDEKELQIGDETYHVQILGFNHDDKSDGTGKAGITVGLKEIMTTKKVMNSASTNVGGWKDSEMRTYVNGNVYNNLLQEVKDIIKPVDKKTSEGNKSTNVITTSDKLFLLSEVEIFGSTEHSANGEGNQYQYFANGGSKVKYRSGSLYAWCERSPYVSSTNSFCFVNYNGSASGSNFINANGVVFGFSI